MHGKRLLVIGFVGFAVTIGGLQHAQAGDLKITIPKRSTLTPVQRLNREGVDALRKHNYAKAEQLFYKAYLFDPDDAFTLNNLGYISELQGQIDRAQNFYSLAAEQSSEAVIDRASVRRVEGRPMKEALAMSDQPLQINHANVEAVRLLSQGRAPEADLLLEETLKIDSHNVFTLNNMGVAKEMEGEAGKALQYYDQAAGVRSDASAVVTGDRTWRGKPVSEMALQNAKALRDHLAGANDLAEQVAELNLQGVSAVNRNDLRSADADFRKAYALNPNDAFTLNNIGYVAELDGDRETAQFFYDRARQTGGATATVGVASRRTEEGKKLFAVAGDSDSRVEAKVTQDREALRRRHEPVVLRRRDNSIVNESEQPPAPADGTQSPQ
jgi:Flp pilus assembly protein TadD